MARSLGFISICFVWLVAFAMCMRHGLSRPRSCPRPRHGTFRPLGTPPTNVMAMMYRPLLTMPAVQEELNLSEDQKTKVKEATDKSRAAMQKLYTGIREASEADRQAKMEEAGKKMQANAEETKKTIEGILLPKQLERLKGLAWQMGGVMALADKEIQQDLKLSDDQAAKIKAAGEDLRKKAEELMSEGADPTTLRPKMHQLRTDYEKQVMEVLTADQKVSLEKMKGAKFEFPMPSSQPYGPVAPHAKGPAENKERP